MEAADGLIVGYADDCNIYLATRKSAVRVMTSVTGFLEGKPFPARSACRVSRN